MLDKFCKYEIYFNRPKELPFTPFLYFSVFEKKNTINAKSLQFSLGTFSERQYFSGMELKYAKFLTQ